MPHVMTNCDKTEKHPPPSQELRGDIEAAASGARELHVSTRRKMGDLGQSLPPDTGTKLANLELGAEQAVASLGEAEQEHKRARTVRYDFQVIV